MSIKVNRKIKL